MTDVGPIDYLAVEFPGARLDGEGLAELLNLVDAGIIRILDLRVAKVELDGTFTPSRSPTSMATESWTSRSSQASSPA